VVATVVAAVVAAVIPPVVCEVVMVPLEAAVVCVLPVGAAVEEAAAVAPGTEMVMPTLEQRDCANVRVSVAEVSDDHPLRPVSSREKREKPNGGMGPRGEGTTRTLEVGCRAGLLDLRCETVDEFGVFADTGEVGELAAGGGDAGDGGGLLGDS
jgi:hypothetical protein